MSPTRSLSALPGYDAEQLYRAVSSRDRRFDGRFVLGVTSTGIYCRPSCPARTPRRENVCYFALPAAAVAAGFRACRRCRPDQVVARPYVADESGVVERALTLIGQGVVDEVGVPGLAAKLAISERHLHRTLVAEVGVGPLALARTRRAQTARLLLEQTDLSITDVGFAAGFTSIRQFNDVMRAEFGSTPTLLRRRPAIPDRPSESGVLSLRLAAREPFDGTRLARFLSGRAVSGVESVVDGVYRRSLSTPAGHVTASVTVRPEAIAVELQLPGLAALQPSVAMLRRLFDLDADAPAIDEVLATDPALAPLVAARPGLRVPGAASGFEIAVRAVVGQQISVAGARTLLGRVVQRSGARLATADDDALIHAFPTATELAAADLGGLGLTSRRIATLHALAHAVASGDLDLDLGLGADRDRTRARLLAVPGIGPWTVEYIALRALSDPDAFPDTDLVIKRRVAGDHLDPDRWRPWRAYAALHLWTDVAEEDR